MKQVPYHGNPGNACALACYTMAAQYLMPEKNFEFEQLGKIADWHKGYTVWGFKLWEYLMDQGIRITDYDVINYEAWAREGTEGLKKSTPSDEFKFYQENTYDLDVESRRVKLMLDHPNFTYVMRKPLWKDVETEFGKPGICDVTLNSRLLNRQKGFSLHRVILLDITDKEVVFQDPNHDWSGKERREPLGFFKDVFEALDGPELARYSK